MRVGELARRTGVGVTTLRAWERRFGLLEPNRSRGGQRLYAEADVESIAAVRRLQAEGLTLPAAVARVRSAGAGALPTGEGETLLLYQIIQAAGEGIWVSREGHTRYANRRMAELLGCSLDELLARPVLDFVDPEYLPLVRDKGTLGRGGHRQRFEVKLRRADGSTFLAETSTSPFHDRAGRYEGAVAIVSDITARKDADEQARFRAALLDSVGQAVAAATPDGTLTYLNPAAEQLFGWRASEALGKNGLDLFAVPGRLDEATQIHDDLLVGKRYSGHITLARRDGTSFAAHMTSEQVLDDDGQLIGLIAAFSDVTDRNRLERQLETRDVQAETVAMLGVSALHRQQDAVDAVGAVLIESLEATRRILEVDYATIFEVVPGRAELVLWASSPEVDVASTVPAGSRSLAGYTALTRSVVVVEDVNHERRFEHSRLATDLGTVSAIAAPVFGPAGVRAVVSAQSSAPRQFDRSASQFMQCIANVIGAALH
jgi:PAS domain S-box-containing protein